MPTYGKENFKESNVNYLNKDFTALKQSLMNYAKSYFPNTYRDFNETSPGMMLLEMNAYVGDVLSFYIDQQYRELLLPLAEERRNIITMAKMFGYKVKPIVPAYADLTFTSEVNASSGDVSKVDYSNAGTFDAGIEIPSSTNSDIIFTTLEPIDFRISESIDTETIGSTNDTGLTSTYTLSRTVRAVSATEKTITFQVGIPEKFKTLTIPDTNVIDIISCVDSNGQNWYEVDFLAQDKVPIETHYTDSSRQSAYHSGTGLVSTEAVPFTLSYITTTKRFTRETNEDNTTSLVFGNGVLQDGNVVDNNYIDTEQIGIVIPGQTNDLNDSINPLLGNEYSTLGETPNNTTLTITYRVGGGINSNVPSGDVVAIPTDPIIGGGNTNAVITSVTNNSPARGGKDEEDTIEIKEKAKAFFSTQNRCVTKEDYEARVLNIPSKFGNIAKVYVTRNVIPPNVQQIATKLNTAQLNFDALEEYINGGLFETDDKDDIKSKIQIAINNYNGQPTPDLDMTSDLKLGTVNIYVLGYNNGKQLVGNHHTTTTGTNDNLPTTLKNNIKNYLENFRILTDGILLQDGYIINFGVFFDVIAEKYADKQKVKLDCIEKIKDYFRIEKMQFNQPIYKSNLEYELMGIEGVRSIGHVEITQGSDDLDFTQESEFSPPLYSYSFDQDVNNGQGGYISSTSGQVGYGYKYDFKNATSDDGTIILPAETSTPAVFELKNPNDNIKGRVR